MRRRPFVSAVRPRALPPGGTVGVCAPSSAVQPEALASGLDRLREMGYEVVVAPHTLGRAGYLSGSDGERLADLQGLLADPGVDAVVAARGGYGAMRLLPGLDLEPLRARPKAVVGFSDITALHLAIRRAGLVSFHGPMAAGFGGADGEANLRGLLRALGHSRPLGLVEQPPDGAPPLRTLVPGRARGELVGGNLSLLAATLGTPWEVETEGRLLLLEEVGEAPYRVDRLLTQLLLAGKLQAAAGILVGESGAGRGAPGAAPPGTDTADATLPPDHPTVLDVFAERLVPLGLPCFQGLAFGHGRHRLTLPLGVEAAMDAGLCRLEGLEAAVV